MAQLGTIIFSTGGGPDDDDEEEEQEDDGRAANCSKSSVETEAAALGSEDIQALFLKGPEPEGLLPDNRAHKGGRKRGRRIFLGLMELAKDAIKTVKQDPLSLSESYLCLLRRCLAASHTLGM